MITANIMANWGTIGLFGFLAIALVAMYFFSARKAKKQQEEQKKKKESIKVGTKIMTIGCIIGTIIEVKERGYVIETGTEDNKSYIEIEERAIYDVLQPVEQPEQGQAPVEEPEQDDEPQSEEPFESVDVNETVEHNQEDVSD